ncbi:hypothetical protein FRACYDRAFT_193864 [Fragilariopsis cylindrus CCMP1102]|uniref:Flagellar associated protein n=1 Tax=Fragilariopsis cylindrus CCMP1102 TaxID=635003 RepID=A0A1E7EXJ1_9STRA|nr:hypothetical protein FRACYDRAFT_193864 [Fragilariopsis cylindrus CCMP1102]|eukprot:OEU10567.1 hypothetical protein FRACYDRAFT_193864 [Fragilariopsis cylindrus CCMP1102]
MASTTKNLVVDPFCYRQFQQYEQSKTYGGTVFSLSIEEFEKIVNERYKSENLQEGYAPFCKHIFLMNNFTGSDGKANTLPVKGNEHLIRSEYAARNDKEVPVLQRFIPLDAVVGGGIEKLPVAKYLDLILYSREQIQKENASMEKGKTTEEEEEKETAPWGIVSIKAQDEDFELPMNPITQMRNALGKEEGGSGIPIDRDAYMKSVEFWSTNVNIS